MITVISRFLDILLVPCCRASKGGQLVLGVCGGHSRLKTHPVSSRRTYLCNVMPAMQEIEKCCKLAGPIDILINNVCVQLEAPCHEHSLEDWNKTLAIGLNLSCV